MSYIPSQEGTIPFNVPTVDQPCETYYKIFGDLAQRTPLVVIHGGPGAGHDYMLAFSKLWEASGIPVIFYDQIGCGKSTHLRDRVGEAPIWGMQRFVAELENLLDHFKLRDDDGPGFHLIGHSWGGRIAPTMAAKQPRGLRRLVIASGSASEETRAQSFSEIREMLPEQHRRAVTDALQSGDYTSEGYKAVMGYFMREFLCRTDNQPPESLASNANIADDSSTRKSILGPSPFGRETALGWHDWTIVPELHRISVPTLIYNTEFDTNARDVSVKPFFDLIPKVRWVKFNDAGHMVHFERPELQEKVLKLVGDFLQPA